MTAIIIPDRSVVTIRTRVRAWDCDVAAFPERDAKKWVKACKRDGSGTAQVLERENLVMLAPMQALAALATGTQAAWQTYRWHRQALGTGRQNNVNTLEALAREFHRQTFTELLPEPGQAATNIVTSNTFVTSSAYHNFQGLVAAAPAPTATAFTLQAVAGATPAGYLAPQPGDRIRVGLGTGYEYRTIDTVGGSLNAGWAITVTEALTAAPVAGNTVDGLTDEAGFFGHAPANYTTGTVAVTNGNPIVTGTGTAWANLVNVVAGLTRITLPGDDKRRHYLVQSVDSPTQLTLAENYAGPTGGGKPYYFSGSLFNRVQDIRHVKIAARGFVYENQWTHAGG